MNVLNDMSEDEKKNFIDVYNQLINKLTLEIPAWKLSLDKAITKHTKADTLAYHSANVPILIRLSILDILILFKQILSTNSDTEQNLFARLICAQLYEFLENVPKIFGKKYREK
jgi:hypothetical protein